jgi:hypothetical protein
MTPRSCLLSNLSPSDPKGDWACTKTRDEQSQKALTHNGGFTGGFLRRVPPAQPRNGMSPLVLLQGGLPVHCRFLVPRPNGGGPLGQAVFQKRIPPTPGRPDGLLPHGHRFLCEPTGGPGLKGKIFFLLSPEERRRQHWLMQQLEAWEKLSKMPREDERKNPRKLILSVTFSPNDEVYVSFLRKQQSRLLCACSCAGVLQAELRQHGILLFSGFPLS